MTATPERQPLTVESVTASLRGHVALLFADIEKIVTAEHQDLRVTAELVQKLGTAAVSLAAALESAQSLRIPAQPEVVSQLPELVTVEEDDESGFDLELLQLPVFASVEVIEMPADDPVDGAEDDAPGLPSDQALLEDLKLIAVSGAAFRIETWHRESELLSGLNKHQYKYVKARFPLLRDMLVAEYAEAGTTMHWVKGGNPPRGTTYALLEVISGRPTQTLETSPAAPTTESTEPRLPKDETPKA